MTAEIFPFDSQELEATIRQRRRKAIAELLQRQKSQFEVGPERDTCSLNLWLAGLFRVFGPAWVRLQLPSCAKFVMKNGKLRASFGLDAAAADEAAEFCDLDSQRLDQARRLHAIASAIRESLNETQVCQAIAQQFCCAFEGDCAGLILYDL